MTEPAKPGVMDRLRARFRWFDRVMRAQERYNDSKGDFYAAGITYFTIFALFPLLMVGFAVGGFVLASRPDLLAEIESKIKSAVSGDLGQQLVNLMDSAIESRTSVGIIGLATAAWAGLGWMANLREALSQMWGLQRRRAAGLRPHQALGSGRAALGVRRDRRHRRADRARQRLGDAQRARMARGARLPGAGRAAAGRVAGGGPGRLLAAVHLDHRPAAAGVGQLPQRGAGRVAGRGRVRDLQAGRRRSTCSRCCTGLRARRSAPCSA